jgi:hypothetical protein
MPIEQDTEITRVTFRKDKQGDFKGSITAVFYDHVEPSGCMGCYASQSQHSNCSYCWYSTVTTYATEPEYRDLKAELERIGYKLKVTKRIQRKR